MKYLANFLKRKKVVVMVAYGGVGEFLFQLDLAKRFESNQIQVLFLIKAKYTFFCDIAQQTNLTQTRLVDATLHRYYLLFPYIWALSFIGNITCVNSFNSLFYRWPTKLLYLIASLFGAQVIISRHKYERSLPYEQVPYADKEMIWQRNIRIVNYVTKNSPKNSTEAIFPCLEFKQHVSNQNDYIHIHPVGSSLKKSIPIKKLLDILNYLVEKNKIVISMTPNEERWYMTSELQDFIIKNNDKIECINRYFTAKEISSLIQNARLFFTVNTGLLWLGIMLKKKVLVFDTFTDYEWNPSPYAGVIRLSHDYNEKGESLHLVVCGHEDGVYFESMYAITFSEVKEAFKKILV